MTEEQFKTIHELLIKIHRALESIENNTGDISDVKDNTAKSLELLTKINGD